MKKRKGVLEFLRSRESEGGQVLVIAPFVLLGLLFLAGLGYDTFSMIMSNIDADTKAARACVAGAEAAQIGGDYNTAFESLLINNGYSTDRFSPKEGTGLDLTKGFEQYGSTWLAAVSWEEPTAFLGLLGIRTYPVLGQSRCVSATRGGLTPIAVRKSAVQDSINGTGPDEYTILGRDPKWDLADKESGENFRGAVFMHMWCIPYNDSNCPDVRVFFPLTENPPSASTQKKLVSDCFLGINCSIWPDVGVRLPIVAGTSNAQICKSFQDGGWQVGDRVVVVVFDGEVYSPEATFGNWENVKVVGYAVYQITKFEPNPNNCNHVLARLYSPYIYSSLDDIPNDVILLKSREIQWDYQGGIPW